MEIEHRVRWTPSFRKSAASRSPEQVHRLGLQGLSITSSITFGLPGFPSAPGTPKGNFTTCSKPGSPAHRFKRPQTWHQTRRSTAAPPAIFQARVQSLSQSGALGLRPGIRTALRRPVRGSRPPALQEVSASRVPRRPVQHQPSSHRTDPGLSQKHKPKCF